MRCVRPFNFRADAARERTHGCESDRVNLLPSQRGDMPVDRQTNIDESGCITHLCLMAKSSHDDPRDAFRQPDEYLTSRAAMAHQIGSHPYPQDGRIRHSQNLNSAARTISSTPLQQAEANPSHSGPRLRTRCKNIFNRILHARRRKREFRVSSVPVTKETITHTAPPDLSHHARSRRNQPPSATRSLAEESPVPGFPGCPPMWLERAAAPSMAQSRSKNIHRELTTDVILPRTLILATVP